MCEDLSEKAYALFGEAEEYRLRALTRGDTETIYAFSTWREPCWRVIRPLIQYGKYDPRFGMPGVVWNIDLLSWHYPTNTVRFLYYAMLHSESLSAMVERRR